MATTVGSEFDHVDFTRNNISVRHPFKDPGGRELIRELQTTLNEKEGVIFNEVDRTAVASFEDGANNMPLKKLTVWMDPKQDLNGQSKPWFPGGGTNRLPFPYTDTDKTVNGITFTVQDDASSRGIYCIQCGHLCFDVEVRLSACRWKQCTGLDHVKQLYIDFD